MKIDTTFVLNLFVVLLFVFINPFYAVSICAVVTFRNYGINFRLFSIMFASSFGLFFFLRDWSIGYDAAHFLLTYREADSYSLIDIFSRVASWESGREPLWHLYLWLSRIIIGDHVEFFAFYFLFTVFFLTAYLGKVIDEKRFVVVIVCLLFVSTGFLSNVYQVWRHTVALLLFFTGIFWLEADRHRRFARGLMYSSLFFHVVTIPIVTGYETLTLLKKINARSQRNTRFQKIRRYSIQAVAYAILAFFTLKWFAGVNLEVALPTYAEYSRGIGMDQSGYGFLFNPLTFALIYYFWFNRKQISTNDVFIGINYFVVICAIIMSKYPSTPLGRVYYFFTFGASILSAKLVLKEKKQGFLFLFIIIFFAFYSYIKHGGGNLLFLVGGNYLNPVYGLLGMILNYSEFLRSSIL